MNTTINGFYTTRKNLFDKLQSSNISIKILMSLLMACFTGIMAQIMIPLPWTPVPITAQTFAVLVAGLLLGKKYGLLSQILYILIGITFIPWFGEMSGGLDIVLGSTGGYFLGFLIASYFIGAITEKYASSRKFTRVILVIGIANFALIYIPGLAGLAIWTYITQGTVLSIYNLLIMGFVPFIFGDIVKILGASTVSKICLPKE